MKSNKYNFFNYLNLGYYILLFIIFVLVSLNISLISDNKELEQKYNDKSEFANLGWDEFNKLQNKFNNLQVERNFYRLKHIECYNKIDITKPTITWNTPYPNNITYIFNNIGVNVDVTDINLYQ